MDRLFRRGIFAETGYKITTRKDALFEAIELLSELREEGGLRPNRTAYFRSIFSAGTTLDTIVDAFESAPPEIHAVVRKTFQEVHRELSDCIKESLLHENRLDADGNRIEFRDPYQQKKVELSWSDFIGKVMRALRNAHHGYLLKKHHRKYFDLVTGNIPDSITRLGLIGALAAAMDYEAVVGLSSPDFSEQDFLPREHLFHHEGGLHD